VANLYSYVTEILTVWDQRPLFKANLSNLVPLRRATPWISDDKLRKMTEYFPTEDYHFPLDPSFEPDAEPKNPTNEANIYGPPTLSWRSSASAGWRGTSVLRGDELKKLQPKCPRQVLLAMRKGGHDMKIGVTGHQERPGICGPAVKRVANQRGEHASAFLKHRRFVAPARGQDGDALS
jgi:hypothetical protein